MASNTGTVPVDSGTETREATRPPRVRPPSRNRRAALGWVAIIGACSAVGGLAVATFTGGDDASDIRARRVAAQAEEYEREAHLQGQAETYAADNGSTTPLDAARHRAAQEAEGYERQAHLEGQARTYGTDNGSTNSTDSDPYDDEFVPGSRHMPTR